MVKLKKLIAKLIYFTGILSLLGIGLVHAQVVDLETSIGNVFTAASLDLLIHSDQTNFIPNLPATNINELKPGNSASRDIYLSKTLESIDLKHQVNYVFAGGNENFCDQLWLTITYFPAGGGSIPIYDNFLNNLNNFQHPDFVLPHANGDLEQHFVYTVILPSSLDPIYQNQTCQFNLAFKGFQPESDGIWGLSDEEILTANSLGSDDWVAPESAVNLLAEYQTTTNFNVDYDAFDNLSLIDTVKLYYRYQGGPWQVYNTDDVNPNENPHHGSFNFTALDGDGLYEFFTIALDTYANLENDSNKNGILEPGEYPLLADASTTVDTNPPKTILIANGSREINEKVVNGNFESGLNGWSTQGAVEVISGDDGFEPNAYRGSKMVRLGYTTDPDNNVWENKITQQIRNGAKNLSFYFKFYSYDDTLDSPGMLVKINDWEVFRITAWEIEAGADPNHTDWKQVSFDLTGINDPLLEIIFYSGHTGDTMNPSWAYVDEVSTGEAFISNSTNFTLAASDLVSGISSTHYSLDGINFYPGTSFSGADLPDSGATIYFYSIDKAGNTEGISSQKVVKDNLAPEKVDDLDALPLSQNEISLSWTAAGDNGGLDQASVYDIRYTTTAGCMSEAEFASAAKISNTPAPATPGTLETFIVNGLIPDTTYYFSLKTGDSVVNWSPHSNCASATTLAETPEVDIGEVVINELMWMGSRGESGDEWLELRNMTDKEINLTEWQIIKKKPDGTDECMFTFPAGSSIKANDYVVVSEYDQEHSKLNITCPSENCFVVGDGAVNEVDFTLANTKLQLKLYDGYWILPDVHIVDTADDWIGAPAGGQHEIASDIFYSMERNDNPGDGTQAANWHTCFAESSLISSYWDLGFVEKGTPAGPNMSQYLPVPIIPTLDFNLSADKKAVSFKLNQIVSWQTLNYEITYNANEGQQGITGNVELNGQNEIKRENLKLGTCSSLGEICTYNTGINNLKMKAILKKENEEKILEKKIEE